MSSRVFEWFRKGLEIEQLENEQFEKFAGWAVGYVVEWAVGYVVTQWI